MGKWLLRPYIVLSKSLVFLQAHDASCCYSSNHYLGQKLHSVAVFIFEFPFYVGVRYL